MKKHIFLSGCLLLAGMLGRGQYNFVTPAGGGSTTPLACEVNVNDRSDQDFRNDIKRAAFKIQMVEADGGTASCSATLINRNTSQNDLGQYFITAWHCFQSGNLCGGTTFDFTNREITMIFNYQSPQNHSGQVFEQNQSGTQYQITRRCRLVDKVECAYGDFALCQIMDDPIPAYFNVYYAGWYPTDLNVAQNGQFASIHHPRGDIKKITSPTGIVNNSGGVIATGCKTITKLIDFLFGWIWGHRWSTQVVCTYLEVPYAGTRYSLASPLAFGKFEDGSSGGGLFTGNSGFAGANRHIGQLSATFPNSTCGFDVSVAEFGKLSESYYRQTIKNTLNPPNDYWTDQNGISGRQISCYAQVSLDPGNGDPYNLYPASLYQADNHIVLNAQTTFNAGNTSGIGTVVVKNGADFSFQAGQTITLNPGFQVETGGTFQANIVSACSIAPSDYQAEPQHAVNTTLNGVRPDSSYMIPQKQFDINKYLNPGESQSGNMTQFSVFPNPSKGSVAVDLFLKEQESSLVLTVYDVYGKAVYIKSYKNVYFIQEQVDLPPLPSGMYSLTVRSAKNTYTQKLVLIH